MKLYDFDGMFDEKLSEYLSKNSDKYKQSEWEDLIPKLYQRFGDTPIKSIGKSPRAFYAEMTDEQLLKCLKAHINQGVSVSEFLRDEIEGRNMISLLIPLLDGTEKEQAFTAGLIGADERVIKKYLQMLVKAQDEDAKNRLVDLIKEKSDLVLSEALEYYKAGVCREYMLEILSRSVVHSNEVFDILLKEFRCDIENLPMHASYLASYGDERALPYLLEKIEEEGISYIEFRELKYAIEALGGEYAAERDFSNDPAYLLIKSQSSAEADIFGGTK